MSEKPSPLPGASRGHSRRMSRRGAALLYVIAVIVLLGAVSGGVAYFSSSSGISDVAKTAHNKAYYAALSGLRYAKKLTSAGFAAIENSVVTYTLSSGVAFRLTVGTKTVDGYPVTSRGISGAGTSLEANHQLAQVTVKPSDEGGYDIHLPGDGYQVAGAYSVHGTAVANDLMDVVKKGDPEYTGTEYIRLGNQSTQGFACLWFNDTKTVQEDAAWCKNGVCKFGTGFRLYFEVMVASAGADGFTLSFLNAANNTVSDCGGDIDMGELLGYGGPGVSGHGLRPAKIAIEFDTFQNGSGTCTGAGSRSDDDDGHVAYVYWGTIQPSFFSSGCKTYDDNQHGVVGGTNSGYYDIDGQYVWNGNSVLKNTTNLDNAKLKTGSNITYKRVTNLEDGLVHTVRMDVTRTTNPGGSGTYTLKTWLDCTAGGNPCTGLKDLDTDFSAQTPSLVTTFTMDKYFHGLLNTFLVGFTQATGASAQEVRLMDFRLRFRK